MELLDERVIHAIEAQGLECVECGRREHDGFPLASLSYWGPRIVEWWGLAVTSGG
jgi:hypothetical protein